MWEEDGVKSIGGSLGKISNAMGAISGTGRQYTTAVDSCKNFIVSQGQEVQINVVAYMYYKGKRISKVVDFYRKELHPKITQELHALNMGLEGTNHYAYVSICSPKVYQKSK